MIKISGVIFIIALLNPVLAVAQISLVGKNRIIFENEGNGNRTRLDISNQRVRSSLASITIDWGGDRDEDVPLAISSPLVRIPAEQQKSIELFYQGQGLPKDRESYFLLSILDVPITPQEESALQIAMRHRYKLFFRPKLDMTPDQAAALLTWQRLPVQGEIEANNPSPYYLTITHLTRQGKQGRSCGEVIAHTMLEPFSKKVLASNSCFDSVQGLQYNIVTDSGREVKQQINLELKGE
ncbi:MULTISPECIES: molecular chaperone [Pseudomonas]|uniref:Gram-negative pili assembly chaperone n=1 Tax=Pseudomonas chlororaphis O6 TaxID=1037915 RepID=A0AB33WUU9_9PSED|nr:MULTISPECIES: molecular chaperone [Pseudomonas]EIM16951.1 putative gram-negative pili assembly chaperone [Pseudomonas chlororaphis O6]UUT22510.1 molecular chaperone [Pseudomonas sp. T8]